MSQLNIIIKERGAIIRNPHIIRQRGHAKLINYLISRHIIINLDAKDLNPFDLAKSGLDFLYLPIQLPHPIDELGESDTTLI